MVNSESIAVLMTCYNRRETTLACLRSLFEQGVNFEVYLVDDGSSDGTGEAVKTTYPTVNILRGTGNLYWGGGMRLAFGEALKQDYAFYLWLNDDTLLNQGALRKLLTTSQTLAQNGMTEAIIVGSTCDRLTKKATYGGTRRVKQWYSNKYEFIEPRDYLQESETLNGNCVLIPRAVAAKVGNIDPVFIHSLGDLDYGLRARKRGCSVWIAPGFVGTCSHNQISGSWADKRLPLRDRLKKVIQPKAFPLKAWTVFTRRHSGFFWFLYWILPYLRAIIGYRQLNQSWFRDSDVKE